MPFHIKSRQPFVFAALVVVALFVVESVSAQVACTRIMDQDSSLNNLVDPVNLPTAPLGTLGGVEIVGTGPQAMILIPGMGFGNDALDDLMAPYKDRFTMYAVTLPGMAGTPAPPSPAAGVSYGEQTWTDGALRGIEKLMLTSNLKDVIVVGHWMTGTQLALRLAKDYPNRIKAVVMIAGTAAFFPTDTVKWPPAKMTLEWRRKATDQYTAPVWFKTVTRETWDDNNFLPNDYAINPVLGLRLWRKAATPHLHVWIRYLCEFQAQDSNMLLDSVHVPVLLMRPGLEGNYCEPGQDYMRAFCHLSWSESALSRAKVKSVTIPNSRIFIWLDQPERFRREFDSFLASVEN